MTDLPDTLRLLDRLMAPAPPTDQRPSRPWLPMGRPTGKNRSPFASSRGGQAPTRLPAPGHGALPLPEKSKGTVQELARYPRNRLSHSPIRSVHCSHVR
jgi:hypothetical protein